MDTGLNIMTKNWVGYFKLHKIYPHKDGVSFLKSKQRFMMEMEDGEVISKVEKGFDHQCSEPLPPP